MDGSNISDHCRRDEVDIIAKSQVRSIIASTSKAIEIRLRGARHQKYLCRSRLPKVEVLATVRSLPLERLPMSAILVVEMIRSGTSS